MILTNQLEFTLIVNEVDTLYNPNLDDLLLIQAKAMYEKKCYTNQYIYYIENIVRRSKAYIIQPDLDAKCRIYVTVKAKVIKYDQYDIITNMRVSQIINKGKIRDTDLLECRNDHCIALLVLNENLPAFKVNDIISICVGTSIYKINNSDILISAFPFIPSITKQYIYHISDISENEIEYINKELVPSLNNLIEEKNTICEDKLIKTRWEYFNQLLYPYKVDKSKQIKSKDLIDFLDFKSNEFIQIDNRLSLSELKLSIEPSSSDDVINDHAINFYEKAIFAFCKHISVVNSMAKIYKNPIDFDNHQYLFEYYALNKLD
jgi:hypothetical protein